MIVYHCNFQIEGAKLKSALFRSIADAQKGHCTDLNYNYTFVSPVCLNQNDVNREAFCFECIMSTKQFCFKVTTNQRYNLYNEKEYRGRKYSK